MNMYMYCIICVYTHTIASRLYIHACTRGICAHDLFSGGEGDRVQLKLVYQYEMPVIEPIYMNHVVIWS